MFLFYVLSFFQKKGHYSRGGIIQRRTLFKEIRYSYLKQILFFKKYSQINNFQAIQESDVDFMLDELDRLGHDL